ncbi:HTH DNA binding protein [Mycobacterium phage Indlulamithi]|uniref:Helix-turn-helix DNA binding domain protein n=1 Tax=Mycobacterium phage Indlulamithi TaxID=2656582 RepID=A0A649VCP6_9CAUD|nr:HTH DNA binding protein [Mycobacterium phage Indlulamithi]QGJ90097.1 hypothetical protein PBI_INDLULAMITHI_58 [Mycobacterium phage Indlulamithi]
MARQQAGKAKSIQAEPKRGHKSSTADLQAKTLRKAHRQGMAWDDYEVTALVKGIERDATTFDIAMSIGRSYYAVMTTRRAVGFAMRHANAIWGDK